MAENNITKYILIRLIIIFTISAVTISVFTYFLIIEPTKQSVLRNLYFDSETLQKSIENEIHSYENQFIGFLLLINEDRDINAYKDFLKRSIEERQGLEQVYVLDREKKIEFMYPLEVGMVGIDLSEMGYIAHDESIRIATTNTYVGGGKIAISQNVDDKVYVMIFGLDLDKTFNDVTFSLEDSKFAISDAKKFLMLTNTNEYIYIEPKPLESISFRISNKDYDAMRVRNVNGTNDILLTRYIESLDLRIDYSITKSQFDELNNVYLLALILSLVIVLIVMLVIYNDMKKKLIGPLVYLRNNFVKIADNDTSAFNPKPSQLTEISDLNSNFDTMMHSIQEKENQLGEFVYFASHDLQEPLRVITSYIQILEMEIGDTFSEDNKKYFNYVKDGARRMATLIKELLSYSKTSEKTLNIRTLNIQDIIDNIKIGLFKIIEESNTHIQTTGVEQITADNHGIEELLTNLITNSIKFNKNTPEILISFDGRVLEIKDNGIGIEEAYFEKIMKPFSRLHTNAEYKGTGIGMAIVKKVIERHGWHYSITSQLGHGTTISIYVKE